MTGSDLDRLDAAIAASPGPVIAMPRALIEQLARLARVSLASDALAAGQRRMDAAIAGIGAGGLAGSGWVSRPIGAARSRGKPPLFTTVAEGASAPA